MLGEVGRFGDTETMTSIASSENFITMGLTDFLRINLPYGLKRNSKDEWFAFNREYLPLGWNSRDNSESIFSDSAYAQYPVYTKYAGLTEKKILEVFESDLIRRAEDGRLIMIFLYDDNTNPTNNSRYWNNYFEKIKFLSGFSVKEV